MAPLLFYSAGAIHYWMPCHRQLSHLAGAIYWMPHPYHSIRPAHSWVLFRQFFLLASALSWMPRQTTLRHAVCRRSEMLSCPQRDDLDYGYIILHTTNAPIWFAQDSPGSYSAQPHHQQDYEFSMIFMTTTCSSDIIPYSPRDASLELVYSYRLHKWEVQLLASIHPSPSSQGPWHSRPWRCWARTISWIAWALFAQCPVSATWQGWFPCTYSYPRQSQVLTMLPDWIEKLMLLPSPIPIPQTQAQLR